MSGDDRDDQVLVCLDPEEELPESATNPRVSWVYKLHKEQAIILLRSFGLPTDSTMAKIRRMLVEHHRQTIAWTADPTTD
ncbi:hypothetical protein LSTR_LSTR015005 [Laodelphax striatellus]|uniref:Uncharacterized protein n=1 Tax=Laodelphax striatellus TaxID=195883 RepID=A0A482WQU7_LAOST|nr:hypothetical protein LSTR_LSTR015005 [Laodelphax striatellus]